MIEYFAGIATAAVAAGLAYGDLRGKIGKLEGKVDLISQNLIVYLNENGKKP